MEATRSIGALARAGVAGKPVVARAALGDFVEAPALSADERLLYFHRKVGTDFRIFAVETP